MSHIGKTESRGTGTDKQDREVYRHFPYNITDIQYYNTNTPTAKKRSREGSEGIPETLPVYPRREVPGQAPANYDDLILQSPP